MSVGVSLLLCLPGGCSGVMLPFANPLFPDLSSTSSVIPAGNPSTWNLSPEGSLGCLHGTSSQGEVQDVGGLRGKSCLPPISLGYKEKFQARENMFFPFE